VEHTRRLARSGAEGGRGETLTPVSAARKTDATFEQECSPEIWNTETPGDERPQWANTRRRRAAAIRRQLSSRTYLLISRKAVLRYIDNRYMVLPHA
jgi:hypothetical protein